MSRVNIGHDYKRYRRQKREYYCIIMLPLSGVLCVAVVSSPLLWNVCSGPGNSAESTRSGLGNNRKDGCEGNS